jgi:L-iditol 2-dehydrogenase
MFAVQWARTLGAGEIFAVDIFPEKLEVVGELGADVCINSRTENPVEVIKEQTGGRGVERTIEFAGHPLTQEQSILATAKLGTSVWGGISHRGLELSEKAVDDILRKELVIAGSWNSSFAPLRSDWGTSIKLMGLGKIRAGNIITHRLPLERIREAFEMMLAREEYFNKVMFFPEM